VKEAFPKDIGIPAYRTGRPRFARDDLKVMLKKVGVILIGLNLGFLVLLPTPALASDITEMNVVNLTNGDRTAQGLNTLKINSELTAAARAKAKNLMDTQCWDHFCNGISPWQWMTDKDYHYLDAGENLAIDFTSAEAMNDAWLASSTHRANILNQNYKDVGIGIVGGYFKDRNTIIVVQMFGNPDPVMEEDETAGKLPEGFKVDGVETGKEYEQVANALLNIQLGADIGEDQETPGIVKVYFSVKNKIAYKVDNLVGYFNAAADK